MTKVTAKEVREKYINFFKATPRNHAPIDPAPLVLENDPSTLFTSAGMQPLVPYLLGEKHPKGVRLVDSQPSIRLGDVEEVGDNRHETFFEMLGNWSLGDYFKEEQLNWVYEFFTKEIGLNPERLWVSVFEGEGSVPKDTVSYDIWKKIGVPESRIVYYPAKKNWWSMTGTPSQMQVGHIGGPDSEVFYDFGVKLNIHEKSAFRDEKCHPNCDCGRFLEIGNSVFIQYKKVNDTDLEELPQKNVDFGGGLERIVAAANNEPDIFKVDVFSDLVTEIENQYKVKYGGEEKTTKSIRIAVEHMRASAMLISSDVVPSNKTQGYVLRRLLRRAFFHLYLLNNKKFKGVKIPDLNSLNNRKYPLKLKDSTLIKKVMEEEQIKFFEALRKGAKILDKKMYGGKIDGKLAFDLYQTSGLPLELTLAILEGDGMEFTDEDKKEFEKQFENHKNQSRTTSAGVFKGGLADTSEEVIKLHTATHLLLATLRKVLGDHVVQKGQNITKDRSRFDFPHPQKLTDEEIKTIEIRINEVIEKDMPVNFSVMSKDEALQTGAIHAFNEKYADTVKVYYVGESTDGAYSKEFCGGPHVAHTGQIGHVKIKKQEKIGSGLNRIYMVFDPS